MTSRKIATIDMGTNSFLLLIAEVSPNGQARIIHDAIQMPRLGENLQATGVISQTALERATQSLRAYRTVIHSKNVTEVYPFTTAAVREAKNQTEVLKALALAIETPVELIAPHKEAELTFLSVVFEQSSPERAAVIDIGGGSTEIAIGQNKSYTSGHSYPIGTVKLFDSFFKSSITQANIDLARARVRDVFKSFTLEKLPSSVYGTAGSFTHLASIEMSLEKYSSEAVNQFEISKEMISTWIKRCLDTPLKTLSQLKGADPLRIDLMLPGCIIIEQLQECFDLSSIQVKDRGMRYGKLFDVAPSITSPIVFS